MGRKLLAGLVFVVVAFSPGIARAADLGPNVKVFDPSMSTSEIQATVDAIADRQRSNEFGTERYALLFEPGTYGSAAEPLRFEVGYYTEVAGLGKSPGDTVINGAVEVYNQCGADGCFALTNFWRSMSNLTINSMGATDGCRASAMFWAVSQAAPLRRVEVRGTNLSLMDYCTAGPQFASGGFIADSKLPFTINGSQQQFLVRNSELGGWSNAVWNQVFAGTPGAPAQSFPDPPGPYTTLETTPVSREKPYLYRSGDTWRVFVPAARHESRGTSWSGAGESRRLSDFYVARPSDSAQRIDRELARGKDLLLTPGVYDVDRTIAVKRPDTVVLGLGLATIVPEHGVVPMRIADRPGIVVAGLTFDAGAVESPALLQVGPRHAHKSSAADPTTIQDVFFRIGGPHAGRAAVSLVVNSDDVLLDDIWAWRADHGNGVGWTVNTARNGVIVNGDRVTATGLFVEHYQQYNAIWNGEAGRTVFFQNELPYDPPNQAAWQHDGVLGWAAYKVADDVQTHEAWGLGSYIFTNVEPTLHASHAFETPVRPTVRFHDLLTVSLNHAGTIDHVINDTGAPVTPDMVGQPSYVTSYP
jgi:hypothetical protein